MISFIVDWPLVLGPIIGIVLPLVVGLVTRASTHPGLKAVLLAALALTANLLTGIDESLVHHTEYNLGAAIVLGLGTFVVAVAAHYGLFVPTGATAAVQRTLVKD